jgi:predicted N-formylglutamate amidohydrolase
VYHRPGHLGLLAPSLAWLGLCQAPLQQHLAWDRTAQALVRCPCHLQSTQQLAQQARRAQRGLGLRHQLARHP